MEGNGDPDQDKQLEDWWMEERGVQLALYASYQLTSFVMLPGVEAGQRWIC